MSGQSTRLRHVRGWFPRYLKYLWEVGFVYWHTWHVCQCTKRKQDQPLRGITGNVETSHVRAWIQTCLWRIQAYPDEILPIEELPIASTSAYQLRSNSAACMHTLEVTLTFTLVQSMHYKNTETCAYRIAEKNNCTLMCPCTNGRVQTHFYSYSASISIVPSLLRSHLESHNWQQHGLHYYMAATSTGKFLVPLECSMPERLVHGSYGHTSLEEPKSTSSWSAVCTALLFTSRSWSGTTSRGSAAAIDKIIAIGSIEKSEFLEVQTSSIDMQVRETLEALHVRVGTK